MTIVDFAVFAFFASIAVGFFAFVDDKETFENWQKGARRTRR